MAAVSRGYENAPATLLLATACACCSRPLVDAVSVETGVGPDCRAKHGYAEAQLAPDWTAALAFAPDMIDDAFTDDHAISPRAACNKLVHAVAANQTGAAVTAYTCAIRALGFVTLADRIAKRLGAVHVHAVDGELHVKAPYSEAFNVAARGIRGSRWIKETKSRTFPLTARTALWAALCASFPVGTIVAGDHGYAATK